MFQMEVASCRDDKASRVGVAIQAHVIVGLAHPSQSRIVVNFNGISPEICQDFLHNAVEFACSKSFPFFNQCLNLTLEGCFQEVGDEIMEVGVCQDGQGQIVFDVGHQTGAPSSH